MARAFVRHLIVEGSHDQHVILALCLAHKVPETFEVIPPSKTQGLEALLKSIPVRLKSEELETLGIVVDADVDQQKRWQTLARTLNGSGYPAPEVLPDDGWISDDGPVRIGVWVMPNNRLSGAIEEFVSLLIPPEDELEARARVVLDLLESEKLSKFPKKYRGKAFIHTWLAWQKEPGIPMGQAITRKALDAQSPIAKTFTDWLSQLFG